MFARAPKKEITQSPNLRSSKVDVISLVKLVIFTQRIVRTAYREVEILTVRTFKVHRCTNKSVINIQILCFSAILGFLPPFSLYDFNNQFCLACPERQPTFYIGWKLISQWCSLHGPINHGQMFSLKVCSMRNTLAWIPLSLQMSPCWKNRDR